MAVEASLLKLKLKGLNLPIIHLTQANFADGTYRIKRSARYILDEDINFDPTGTRPDIPKGTGWFAAITVETNNVIIDLNGHSIEATQNFINSHFANVFADIELDNCPYAGKLFGAQGSNFTGDTTFVSGNNIWIKNGTLARSSHWGIHGNNNTNVLVDRVYVRDFEVAGIEINGSTNIFYHKIRITGLEHLITVTAEKTQVVFLNQIYNQIIALAPPPIKVIAQEIINNFNAYVAAHPEIYDRVLQYPEGDYYGITMSSGSTNPFGFPTTSEACQKGSAFTNGQTLNNISLHHVCIANLTNQTKDVIVVGAKVPGGTNGNLIFLGNLGIFGALNWFDLFDTQGNFAPNIVAIALTFAAVAVLTVDPVLAANLPPEAPAIFEAILAGDSSTFFNLAIPLSGFTLNTPFTTTGLFAIRIDCSNHVITQNIRVKNLQSLGPPGIDLSSIPGASHYPDLVQPRYQGNDVWGLEFAVGNNVKVKNITVSNMLSRNGDVFGVDLPSSDSNVTIKCALIQNLTGEGTTQSQANHPSEVYGIRSIQTVNLKLIDIIVKNLQVPPNGEIHPIEINGVNVKPCNERS